MNKLSPKFQTIKAACKSTGISQYRLRGWCKSGYCPHIKVGEKYMIDVPRLLEKLEELEQEGRKDA